jgi:hypothetical protein
MNTVLNPVLEAGPARRDHHRPPRLPVNPAEPTTAETGPPIAVPDPSHGPKQHRAALDRRRSDITELAGVATQLDDVDQRTVGLNQRITELLDLALPP